MVSGKRFIIAIFLALFVLGSFAVSQQEVIEGLQKAHEYVQEVRRTGEYDTMSVELQKQIDIVDSYVQLKMANTGKRSVPVVNKREAAAGIYSNVTLSNGDKFGVRQMTRVDVEELLTSWVASHCGLLSFLCNSLLSSLIEDLLPEVIFIQSLNAQANNPDVDENTVEGTATLDLVMHLLTYPGSIDLFNQILEYVNVPLYPTTAVAFFGASADYSLSFDAGGIDFSAQAFAMTQTYKTLIEFKDENNNGVVDTDEAVQEIDLSTIAWDSTTTNEITFGDATVFDISVQNSAGYLKFDCVTATSPLKDNMGAIIHPNSTKCTIEISDFPFAEVGNKLALKVHMAIAGGTTEGTAESANMIRINTEAEEAESAYFDWVPNVQVDGKSFDVVATADVGVSTGILDVLAAIVIDASGSSMSEVKEYTFVFNTPEGTAPMIWDPEVGYGEVPQEASNVGLYIGIGVGVAAAVLAIAGLGFFFVYKKRQSVASNNKSPSPAKLSDAKL